MAICYVLIDRNRRKLFCLINQNAPRARFAVAWFIRPKSVFVTSFVGGFCSNVGQVYVKVNTWPIIIKNVCNTRHNFKSALMTH